MWRPSPTVNETGCYSLVNKYAVTSTSLPATDRVTPLPQNQLQFQPGDVLGFYVESHGTSSDNDNGVVLLNNSNHTSELVWFASIDMTAQISRSGSCPYPVGTNGVLHLSTHAAPVISISVTSYSCPGSSVSFLTPSASVNTITAMAPQQTPTISAPTTCNTNSLVAGVVVAVIIVCIATLVVIAILATVITVKRHNAVKKKVTSIATTTDSTSLVLENQIYGKIL